jgi:hypothetical protein
MNINEVLNYDDVLVHIFRQINWKFRPCLILVCKRWKRIFDKYDRKTFYFARTTKAMILSEIQNGDMSLSCASFLLCLNKKRDKGGFCPRGGDLNYHVIVNELKELYPACFLGKYQFFVLHVFCDGPNCKEREKQIDQIQYELFCQRFGINPSTKGDREYLPPPGKKIKRK